MGAQSQGHGEETEEQRKLLKQIGTAGKILAKCIVDQQLSSVCFTSAVYKKLLLHPLTLDDLEDVDKYVAWLIRADKYVTWLVRVDKYVT